MATTTRQTVRKGAPPPAKRATNGAPPRVVTSPTSSATTGPKGSSSKSTPRVGGNFPFEPFTMALYGPPGVGKSSLAAHFGRTLFIHDSQEQGIQRLVRFGQCPAPVAIIEVNDWQDSQNVLADAANKKWDIDTVVCDSLTGFEKYCFHHHCREQFDNDWSSQGFYAYQSGPKNAAKTDWPDFLENMQSVQRSGISVIALAHSDVKTFKNPDGPDYDKFAPYLDNAIWQQTHRWAEAVIFYNIHVEVGKEKGSSRNKAQSERRIFCTQPAGAYTAKNWWGLEAIINAGESPQEAYEEFKAAYLKALKKGGG